MYRIIFSDATDLLIVVRTSKSSKSIGMKSTTSRVQLNSIVLGKLRTERVDGDDQSAAIGFKLFINFLLSISLFCKFFGKRTYSKNFTHDFSSGATQLLTILEE